MAKLTSSKHIGRIIDLISAIKEHLAYLKVDPDWTFDQISLNMMDDALAFIQSLFIFMYKNAKRKEPK